jgi:transposase
MKRFIQGEDQTQATLLPEALDDYITENNPFRVIDVYVDNLDLGKLGFEGVEPEVTGRPAYHPATLLKEVVYLRLPQPNPIHPTPGDRDTTQCRTDVADLTIDA